MTSEIYNFFINSAQYNILALTTTMVGTLYGIASFIVGNRKREPVFIIQTVHLIREIVNDNGDIKITYKDKEYPNMSSTRFVLESWAISNKRRCCGHKESNNNNN